MFAVFGYVAVCFGLVVIGLQIQQTRRIRSAEHKMANVLHVALSKQRLEGLRDELLALKDVAIKIGFPEMERFYEIEHSMNLLAIKLDQMERNLIDCGLQQPSEKGRLNYMLKLVDMGMAIS